MPLEVVEGPFRATLAQWMNGRRARFLLATPFMSFGIAQWLTTVPAARRGDRRLLVAWDRRSLDDLYLSAAGVEALRRAGFVIRSIRRLHAKVIICGSNAYIGSGNLTAYGLAGGNLEVGSLLTGTASTRASTAYERWWALAQPLDDKQIRAAITRQATIARNRGVRIDDERQPGHRPAPPPPPAAPVLPPDREAAAAANPPAIAHYWRADTIAENLAIVGQRHHEFSSRARMSKNLVPGTRVYTVGWAPMGGILLLNRFVVRDVRRHDGQWRVRGRNGTPLRFDRAVGGQQYARDVRIVGQRQAPHHYMSFSPMTYLSARTSKAFDRLIYS